MFHVFLLWDQWLLRAFLKADGRSGREKSGKHVTTLIPWLKTDQLSFLSTFHGLKQVTGPRTVSKR